jgi:hypothetical protein
VLLLIIGGVEQNVGPGVESNSFMRVICSGRGGEYIKEQSVT